MWPNRKTFGEDSTVNMTTTFPVISSILDPAALASEILPGFRVGVVSECKFYSGGFNHN